MASALILYGSRARGEAESNSDVDLILAEPGSGLRSPNVSHGVSIHWYSQGWLIREAEAGSLFVCHVAYEGVALLDPASFLDKLREHFVLKPSYRSEAAEAAAVLTLSLSQRWAGADQIRRRFFWALRTLMIAESAKSGRPVFSAAALERVVGVPGVAQLIKMRETVSQTQCLEIAEAVLDKCDVPQNGHLSDQELRASMLAQGGMAADSVRLVEEGEIVERRANAPYY